MVCRHKTNRTNTKGFLVDTKSVGIFHGTDGYYTTSEKANEVLDMIQEAIQHGTIVQKTEKFDVCRETVFEMPQDDEV